MANNFDINKPRHLAHTAVSLFFFGFIIQFFEIMWLYLAFYLAAMVLGIITLVKNKNADDKEKLHLIGFMEVGLSILPSVLIIVFTIITIYLLKT